MFTRAHKAFELCYTPGMRVMITKDYWDGSKSKSVETDLDGMPTTELIFMLMTKGVAGVTITKCTDIRDAVEYAKGEES